MVTNLPRAVESFSDSLQTPHIYPQAFITTVFVAEKIPRICFIKPLGLVVVLVKVGNVFIQKVIYSIENFVSPPKIILSTLFIISFSKRKDSDLLSNMAKGGRGTH